MNKDRLHDYVVAHGFGAPTPEGYSLAIWLMETGDDFATAAAEVVARGLTMQNETVHEYTPDMTDPWCPNCGARIWSDAHIDPEQEWQGVCTSCGFIGTFQLVDEPDTKD